LEECKKNKIGSRIKQLQGQYFKDGFLSSLGNMEMVYIAFWEIFR